MRISSLILLLLCACTTATKERGPAADAAPTKQEMAEKIALWKSKTPRAEVLCRPCTNKKSYPVHLTFDDGPTVLTEDIANTLRAKGPISATFFQMGASYSANPKERRMTNWFRGTVPEVKAVTEILMQDGHGIAAHTFQHMDHVTGHFNAEKRAENIRRSFEGFPAGSLPYVRLPYGQGWWKNPAGTREAQAQAAAMEEIHRNGWKHLGWEIDTFDWNKEYNEKQPALLLADVCEKEGGIMLMHDMHTWTAKNLDVIIDSLRCSGHKIVSLGEMEDLNARTPKGSFKDEVEAVPVACPDGLKGIKEGKCLVKP